MKDKAHSYFWVRRICMPEYIRLYCAFIIIYLFIMQALQLKARAEGQ